MFTDGVGSDMSYFEEDADGNGIPDYAELAEKKGVQIVTLAFGDRNLGKITTAQKSLKSISKMTGGQYYYCSIVPNGDEFPVEEVPELSDKVEDIKKSTKKQHPIKPRTAKIQIMTE